MPFATLSADMSVLDQVQGLFRADNKDKLLQYGSDISLYELLPSLIIGSACYRSDRCRCCGGAGGSQCRHRCGSHWYVAVASIPSPSD